MLPPFARILVVDDSQVARKLVRALLAEIGFRNIDEAENGEQALRAVARLNYALMLCDWVMQPMSGIELLKALRRDARSKRLPFIMVTSQSQRKFAEIARDAGATHFLAKPFTARQLAERIRSIEPMHDAA